MADSFIDEFLKEAEKLDWNDGTEETVMEPPVQFKRQTAITSGSQMPGMVYLLYKCLCAYHRCVYF